MLNAKIHFLSLIQSKLVWEVKTQLKQNQSQPLFSISHNMLMAPSSIYRQLSSRLSERRLASPEDSFVCLVVALCLFFNDTSSFSTDSDDTLFPITFESCVLNDIREMNCSIKFQGHTSLDNSADIIESSVLEDDSSFDVIPIVVG